MKRVLLAASAISLALVIGGWIWLTVPYLKVTQVRIDDRPVEVRAAFSNETADALCTKLYELIDGRVSNEPIFSRVARDVPNPNDTPELKEGDRIVLTGYRYEWRMKNRITGHEVKRRDGRVDVIAWSGPSGVEHRSALNPTSSTTFVHENYIGCR